MSAFIKNAWSEYQLRSNVTKAVNKATDPSNVNLDRDAVGSVVELAIAHPNVVINAIKIRVTQPNASMQYFSLLLLDDCLNASNSAFHEAFASDVGLQETLLLLALTDGGSASVRKVRNAARKLILDVSRMFFGTRHVDASRLQERYQSRCGRRLVRAVLAENLRVRITSPRPQDYRSISPNDKHKAAMAAAAALETKGAAAVVPSPIVVAVREQDPRDDLTCAAAPPPELASQPPEPASSPLHETTPAVMREAIAGTELAATEESEERHAYPAFLETRAPTPPSTSDERHEATKRTDTEGCQPVGTTSHTCAIEATSSHKDPIETDIDDGTSGVEVKPVDSLVRDASEPPHTNERRNRNQKKRK